MRTVLIIDDDEDCRSILGEILRCEGYQVATARSGEAGLEALKKKPLPCVVVLDVDMSPGMSGPETAHEMLVHDAGQENIPVVLMSGNSKLPEIAAKMGTPYLLAKPSTLAEIVTVLDRAQGERTPPASA